MMSMVSEVENVIKLYSGLLLRDANSSHPTLQGYEQDLGERLRSNNTVKMIAKSGCVLLMYSSRYIFRGQFLLYTAAVPDHFDALCVAFFTANRASDSLEFTKFCVITRTEWERATLTKSVYRSFNMVKLVTLDLMNNGTQTKQLIQPTLRQSLVYSSDSISIVQGDDDEEAEGALDVPASQFRLFWLHEALRKEENEENVEIISQQHEYLTHYIAFLIDVLVYQRYFTDSSLSLKKSMLRYYASVIDEHHSDMSLLFISQMIEHSSEKMTCAVHQSRKDTARYGDWFIELSETRFYRQWLDAELFLFKSAHWHKDLSSQTRQIQEHINFISARLPSSLHNNWFSYIVANSNLYWLQTGTNTYQISVNWLFKPEFDSLLQTLSMENGCISISTQVFETVFMPTLYRCVLEDVFRCLLFLHHQHPGATIEEGQVRRSLNELRDRFHYKRDDMKDLEVMLEECRTASATSLYDCVAMLRDGNVRSPATKKMLKKRPEFDLTKKKADNESNRVPWSERVIVRSDMPDIEDLGNKKLVPPCMLSIFNVEKGKLGPKLGHQDKMNVVKYLIDLAYTKKEVLYYLCKGWENEPSYMVEIANNYDKFSAQKRHNAKQLTTQHHSFWCGGIINSVPIQSEKNPFRCPYADAACKNSARRDDFNKTEREVFAKECGSTLKRPTLFGIKHPVQYTLFQLDAS